jgi:hypothetical protein
MRNASLSRRAAIAMVLGVYPAISWTRESAPAQQKMTKAQAEYQDTPKGILMCATCTLFVRPASCKVVEGEVSPQGWCKAFDLAD